MRRDEKQQEKKKEEQNTMQELVKDMKGSRRQKEEWREDEDHNSMAARITNRKDYNSDILESVSAALNQPMHK